jgi:transposase
MRKSYSKEFKFKVAIEAIKGDMTIAEIVSKYQVSASLIHKWKKELLSNGPSVYNGSKAVKSNSMSEADIEKLHAKIGRLTLENDFLERALNKIQ